MSDHEHIGWKIGHKVVCIPCGAYKMGPHTGSRLYHGNVYPYRQTCHECGNVMVVGANDDMWPQLFDSVYITVVIPWSDKPTKWHPTEKEGPFSVLIRGAFRTEREAHAWARANLEGQPYSLREVTP